MKLASSPNLTEWNKRRRRNKLNKKVWLVLQPSQIMVLTQSCPHWVLLSGIWFRGSPKLGRQHCLVPNHPHPERWWKTLGAGQKRQMRCWSALSRCLNNLRLPNLSGLCGGGIHEWYGGYSAEECVENRHQAIIWKNYVVLVWVRPTHSAR